MRRVEIRTVAGEDGSGRIPGQELSSLDSECLGVQDRDTRVARAACHEQLPIVVRHGADPYQRRIERGALSCDVHHHDVRRIDDDGHQRRRSHGEVDVRARSAVPVRAAVARVAERIGGRVGASVGSPIARVVAGHLCARIESTVGGFIDGGVRRVRRAVDCGTPIDAAVSEDRRSRAARQRGQTTEQTTTVKPCLFGAR